MPRSKKPPEERNPHAIALAKAGVAKGGKARAKRLTKEQLREQGRLAANVRWAKEKGARSQDAIDEVIAILKSRIADAEKELRKVQAKLDRYRRQLQDAEARKHKG